MIAGKLNALEDWRTARIDLLRKFEIQEAQITEQEERHKRLLYEAEKELIINKARMKKEMEERLMELAQNFRDATNIRIADATHRAIRENIALNKELDTMLQVCRDLDSKSKQYKEKHRTLKLQAALYENEAKMALSKTLKQNQTIEKLAKEHFKMTLECGKLQRAEAKVQRIEQLTQEYKDKCHDVENKIKILEQHTELARKNEAQVMKELSANCQEIQRLGKILREARRCVEAALKVLLTVIKIYFFSHFFYYLQIQTGAFDQNICTACYPNVKEKLLCSLLEILGKESPASNEGPQSLLEVSEAMNICRLSLILNTQTLLFPQGSQIRRSQYELGDLGLVPNRRITSKDTISNEEEKEGEVQEEEENEEEKSDGNFLLEDKVIQADEGEAETDVSEAKKIPSCLISDPESSDIQSPQETGTETSASEPEDDL